MRRWRYIILSGAIILLLGMMFASPSGSFSFWNPTSDQAVDHPTREGPAGIGPDEADAGPALTKRSVRDMGRKPTEEETITLLQTTVVAQFDVEDSTVEETVARLNQLARDRGITARELTISNDHRVSHLRIRELRIRNAPLSVALKYVCDISMQYRVSPGKVMLGSHRDLFEDPTPAGKKQTGPGHDPSAATDEEIQEKKKPVDPEDPFFQGDPFAGPE